MPVTGHILIYVLLYVVCHWIGKIFNEAQNW